MRIVFLTLFVTVVSTIYARMLTEGEGQENATPGYHSFVKEGKIWKVTYWTDGFKRDEFYSIKGDTVINGISCKKMFRNTWFQFGIFEREGKVYAIGGGQINPDKQRLLFDFSLACGEYVFNSDGYGTFKVTVERVDTIYNSQNRPFRRMLVTTGPFYDGHYTEKPSYLELYWIEGVGSTRGPIDSYFWFNGSQPGRRLEEYYEDGECILTHSEMIAEGTSSVDPVTATQTPISSTYDLQGRRLTAAPRKGVYIRDGRKVVVK